MGDMLSQAEIDALLNGSSVEEEPASSAGGENELTMQEIDALGEIGNISMGTSATTLFTLLGHKVLITTPTVVITSWDEMAKAYNFPLVAVRVEYTNGLVGSNLLLLQENDVKIITDLMMGGEGKVIEGDLTDLHLSAISEAMNQMVGSSSTSMSSMFNKRIDISPPKAFIMHFGESQPYPDFDKNQKIVKVAFKMVVGDLIDSEIMQLLPIPFAKSLVNNLLNIGAPEQPSVPAAEKTIPVPPQVMSPPVPPPTPLPQQPQENFYQQPQYTGFPQTPQQDYNLGNIPQGPMHNEMQQRPNVNVQPAHFQAFDDSRIEIEKKNISLIMDVPLQVTVELGRTNKMIRDILEFGPGSIIELDKLAGEPVDILVNGKVIAKGEVVVIDESFGVRIADIIHPSKRL